MMEKDDRILDLAIHYTLNKSYQVTEELTKYQKRAVRKRAATLLVEKGMVYEKGKKSEGDQLCSGAAENLESMPLSCNLRTLWCHKDTQMDCLEVLLKGNGCRCEKVGKQCVVCVVSVVYITCCARLTKYREQLPEISRLILFSNV